jgi:hypothetical protein
VNFILVFISLLQPLLYTKLDLNSLWNFGTYLSNCLLPLSSVQKGVLVWMERHQVPLMCWLLSMKLCDIHYRRHIISQKQFVIPKIRHKDSLKSINFIWNVFFNIACLTARKTADTTWLLRGLINNKCTTLNNFTCSCSYFFMAVNVASLHLIWVRVAVHQVAGILFLQDSAPHWYN